MGLFGSRNIVGIAAETLQFALDSAADSHPNEYMGLLRAESTKKLDANLAHEGLLITDILFIPGTTSNPVSATVKKNMVPTGVRIIGSIHSHPNGVLEPSDTDRDSFGAGKIHIIIGAPYRDDCWQAFDRDGNPRDLDVVNVGLEDPEDFFDFTEADLDLD